MGIEKQPCVYILASKRHGTLYIGVMSDLANRVYQRREGLIPGFTRDYGVKRLVRYEASIPWTLPFFARGG